MDHTKTKAKAVLLILLLGGYEAARISEQASLRASSSDSPDVDAKSASEIWKKENENCSWKLKCQGPGCKYRPLVLDKSLSSSCRLSVNHMLENSSQVEQFADLQADLLIEKSGFFKESCVKSKSWFKKEKWRCFRAGGHMLQASEYLLAMKEKVAKQELPKDCITKTESKVQQAMKSLVDNFGEDGDLVLEFQQKLAAKKMGAAKNPDSTAKMTIDVIRKLLSNKESEREEARAFIKNMPSDSEPEPSDEDKEEIKLAEERVKEAMPMDETQTFERIEGILLPDSSTGITNLAESSLLQTSLEGDDKDKDDKTVKIIVILLVIFFVVPAVLGIIIAIIVAIAGAAAVGSVASVGSSVGMVSVVR